MKITEPTTMITDFLITIESVIIAILLIIGYDNQFSRLLFALSVLLVGLRAFTGGVYHGFSNYLTPAQKSKWWKITLLSLVYASTIMLLAIILSSLTSRLSLAVFSILAILNSIYFTKLVIERLEFIIANLSFGISVVFMIGFKIISYLDLQDSRSKYILLGLFILVGGSIVQISKLAFHGSFCTYINFVLHLRLLSAYYLPIVFHRFI
ncbi:MAG: hypothetical protein IH840_09700 [Candidatus Heimdallarchaeota archaeon]|nr:hypothetical protein [Candidatus Heimdallarchaeota archaeon]